VFESGEANAVGETQDSCLTVTVQRDKDVLTDSLGESFEVLYQLILNLLPCAAIHASQVFQASQAFASVPDPPVQFTVFLVRSKTPHTKIGTGHGVTLD